ncbi:unnamed protein product [Cyclocybe aegerita]|uniref:DUF6697 domain-containing protein n=1 Tax=Cyclocybe aegerita TaxID=1973307 RepID=A0A8S0X8W5_CYCAE|nr:unnamed protein product [Cyclocybe aegerita]
MQRLRSQVRELEARNDEILLELEDMKIELKETQSLLGQTLVKAARQREGRDTTPSSSRCVNASTKRARSSSLEVVKVVVNSQKTEKGVERDALEKPLSNGLSKHPTDAAQTTAKTEKLQVQLTKRTTEKTNEYAVGSVAVKRRKLEPVQEPRSASKKETTQAKVTTTENSSASSVVTSQLRSFAISPPSSIFEVPRAFLRVQYGGSDQQFLQYFRAEKGNLSSPIIRRLVFAQPNMNPDMPSSPGAPGMIYASRHEIVQNPPWTVFYKSTLKPALWTYVGEYESVVSGQLSAAQFSSQKADFKKGWAEQLITAKEQTVYVRMRARIALRKAGLIPLADEKEEARLIEKEVKAVVRSSGLPVREQDLIDALCRGEENIDIIQMTCVKYDHEFANDMMNKLPQFNSAHRKDSKNANSSSRSSARREATQTDRMAPQSTRNGKVDTLTAGPVPSEESRLRRSTRARGNARSSVIASMDDSDRGSMSPIEADSRRR